MSGEGTTGQGTRVLQWVHRVLMSLLLLNSMIDAVCLMGREAEAERLNIGSSYHP